MLKRGSVSLRFAQVSLACAWLAGAVPAANTQPQQHQAKKRTLPTSIADSTFWKMVSTMSESSGFFQSDNFTSNEPQYPAIVSDLLTQKVTGGAYIGVGPEQNFQYIAAIKPRIVFQLDIRRQMIVQHLMYKAIFELTSNRADFVSLLFSKPRPKGLDTSSTIDEIWDAYWYVPTDTVIFPQNLERVRNHLRVTRGFALTDEDMTMLTYVYETFYRNGPIIAYNGLAPDGPNFATLTWARDARGVARSFLASEQNFRFIKQMHHKNLIIPVVADFAGATGIRNVSKYLKAHNARVTAFYVSNVEVYLFRNGVSSAFYANVATLPIDSASVFIRPSGAPYPTSTSHGSVGGHGISFAGSGPSVPETAGSAICSIKDFLAVHAASTISTFAQANMCGK